MTRRKSVCLQWTLVLICIVFCPYVYSRPQETSHVVVSSATTNNLDIDKPTESPIREPSLKIQETSKSTDAPIRLLSTASPNTSRDVKNKAPVIGESIKMVASQLLEKPSNSSESPVVIDTRIPPKVKTQLAHKHKIKTRNEDGIEPMENSHVGIAVPVTMEELEKEHKLSDVPNESSTSNEGISTWILLSNPASKDNSTASTEPTKVEEPPKKQKPNTSKNKTKRPQNNKSPAKRPIIGSTNKSDLVAGGSAINENVYNKIKDTVLSNVQKNKNVPQRTTTSSTTILTTEAATTRKEVTKTSTVIPVVKVTSKTKKNKHKQKASSTEAPLMSDSAKLPMEPKEQEIELEVSTPPTTTKKPKRSSTRKKTKTKKRKTSKPKPEPETAIEIKTANKTKSTKVSKKPAVPPSGPITTQIYNYLSREVMPSVGVGMLGLASLVGIASYFLYPFTTPVRRTFEVDKKDDIYRHNAEEYASEGNGQAEEDMLGTVLAGMPAHSKQKLNPYAAQTPHINRYQVKKEQDIRYRQVATKYEPNYNVRYPQQKTGIAHAAVYAEPVNYNHPHHQYETRHAYTTEVKYDKGPSSYAPYPALESKYSVPQTGSSGLSAYGSDSSNSVVYGVKPSSDSDFKPVYPYEAQFYSETTSSSVTYSPTSMYLGSNNDEEEEAEANKYTEDSSDDSSSVDNKFVVGNVPKELTDSATPAVVPEHGPRKFDRRRRNIFRNKRSIVGSIEELLKAAKENKDVFMSNEIDEIIEIPTKSPEPVIELMHVKEKYGSGPKDVIPIYAVSVDPEKEITSTDVPSTIKTEIIESVSTLPIDNKQENTTENEMSNELDITTKAFRVYEVFSSKSPKDVTEKSSPLSNNDPKVEFTTQSKNMNTETTTEFKSETTSTLPPSPSPVFEFTSTARPRPTYNPEIITYPPLNQEGGFFSFLKRLVEFKYRLGLSILQTTSDSLNRYLRSMEDTVQKVATASH